MGRLPILMLGDYYAFNLSVARDLGIEAAIVYEEIISAYKELKVINYKASVYYQEIEDRLSFLTDKQFRKGLLTLIGGQLIFVNQDGKLSINDELETKITSGRNE